MLRTRQGTEGTPVSTAAQTFEGRYSPTRLPALGFLSSGLRRSVGQPSSLRSRRGSSPPDGDPRDHVAVTIDPEGRLLLVAALGAGMAHEMRNVLAAAESSLYLAAKLGDDPTLRAKHVDAARAHVRAAQGLVDRALAPAKSFDVARETVAIADVCELATRTARVGDPREASNYHRGDAPRSRY